MAGPHTTEPEESAELLSRHVTGLLAGVDRSAELLATSAEPEQGDLAGLMDLARRLHAAMPAVAPRLGFAADLRAQLDLAAPAAEATRRREKEQRRLWIAGISGAVALLGLGLVTYRTARAGARAMPWGKARVPAPASALGPEPAQL
ncbi:MAG: hypothetical protein IT317_07650 [Anaerolineales bacterium]|nr:hypothetical protein [Anaerolineales bacterium]